MAIAAALNILVTSPTAALAADLKKHKVSVTQFSRELTAGLGGAYAKVENDALRIGRSLGIAFDEGIISAKQYAQGIERAAAVQQFLAAGGESYNAMVAEAAKLTEVHTSAIEKQAAAVARLQAMRTAGMIDDKTLAGATTEVMRPSREAGWASLERKARESDAIAGEIKNRRESSYRAQWASLERRARESDAAAGEIKNRRESSYRAQWAALERRARESDEIADSHRDARMRNDAHRSGLFDEANALNAKHAAPLERLNAAKLRLNTLNATGALTQQAFNAEMKAANALYTAQTSLAHKLGFSLTSLKSAASFANPWLIGGAGLALAAKEGMQFEKAMDRVRALTGGTVRVMNELSDAARALGRDTIFSAGEAADAMAKLAKAGVNARDIMASVPAVLSLAAIGELEVGEAAETAARIMAGMRVPASQLADVIDSLAVAASSSNNTVEDLGEAMKFVGPLATQAGVGLEEVMASLMVLGNAGLQGEIGGTGLRNIITRMVDPTKEAKQALDSLGITLVDLQGDMLPMVEVLRQFEQGLEGMGDVEKLQKIAEIFKNRGSTTMAALLGVGSEGFQEMLDLQAQRQGVADEMSRVMNDNLMGDLEMLGSALADLAIDLYDSGVGVVLRELVMNMTQTVKVLQMSFDGVSLVVKEMAAASMYAGAALLEFAGYLLSFSFDSDWRQMGEAMQAKGSAMRSSAGDYMSDTWNRGTTSSTQQVEDFNSLSRRMIGAGSESTSAKLAELEKTRSSLEGEAKASMDAKIETLQRVLAMQKLSESIDEVKAKAEDELAVLKFGKEEVERRKFLEEGLATIEATRESLLEQGARNVAEQLESQRAILAAKVADLKLAQDQIALQEKHNDLLDAIKKSREELATLGMTDGQRAIHGIGNATPEQKSQASFLDEIQSQLELRKALIKAREDELKLAAQIRDKDGNWSKSDDALFSAWQSAQADGIVTAQEAQQLRLLEIELERVDAIEKAIEKRKREEDELKKHVEDMRSFAKDLIEKHNPVRAFQDEFIKLRTSLKAGLIDQATYDSALSELTANTLKSAGPKNIGYAKAVTADSAEGYSAALNQIRNPEYGELKKQTEAIKQSRDALKQIKDNTALLRIKEQLIRLPPG